MSVVTTVSTALDVPERAVRETRPGELLLETTTSELSGFADRVTGGLSGRLLSLFASDERDVSGRFLLHHLWFLPGLRTFLRLAAPVLPAEPSYPSIAAKYPVANWFEREVMDFFGLVPEGHPNPKRVALHDDWPDGAWALRKDFP
ncbi:MAG: NADH-quinone oxidoreductase subunit C, partial [Burkholderiaceae bacterium]